MKTPLENSIPPSLKATQEWFAKVITGKLNKKNHLQPYTNDFLFLSKEASHYIKPNADLSSQERIQIYNQQYWWRLLKILHTHFPFTTRLLGYQTFDEEVAIPYLTKFPPNHWSLNEIGNNLPQWIKSCYSKTNRSLIFQAAFLDWAFAFSFIAAEKPIVEASLFASLNHEELMYQIFYLQPHVHLLHWDYDLLNFRETLLKQEVDYWSSHPFPPLNKTTQHFFVLYRTNHYQIAWRSITSEEMQFLNLFKKGSHLAEAFEWLSEKDPTFQSSVASQLQNWLLQWVQSGWLTLNR